MLVLVLPLAWLIHAWCLNWATLSIFDIRRCMVVFMPLEMWHFVLVSSLDQRLGNYYSIWYFEWFFFHLNFRFENWRASKNGVSLFWEQHQTNIMRYGPNGKSGRKVIVDQWGSAIFQCRYLPLLLCMLVEIWSASHFLIASEMIDCWHLYFGTKIFEYFLDSFRHFNAID